MATQHKLPGAKPSHRIYVVTGEGDTANWREIGAAWPNRDGKGYSITCDAIPLGGRIVMRELTERTAEGPADDQAQEPAQRRGRR